MSVEALWCPYSRTMATPVSLILIRYAVSIPMIYRSTWELAIQNEMFAISFLGLCQFGEFTRFQSSTTIVRTRHAQNISVQLFSVAIAVVLAFGLLAHSYRGGVSATPPILRDPLLK